MPDSPFAKNKVPSFVPGTNLHLAGILMTAIGSSLAADSSRTSPSALAGFSSGPSFALAYCAPSSKSLSVCKASCARRKASGARVGGIGTFFKVLSSSFCSSRPSSRNVSSGVSAGSLLLKIFLMLLFSVFSYDHLALGVRDNAILSVFCYLSPLAIGPLAS